MKLASRFVSVAVATAAASTAAVMVAGPAHAADQYVWSQSGDSYGWYDDANNRFVTCDVVSGDGKGAKGVVSTANLQVIVDRTAFNGCEAAGGVGDGQRLRISVCDWVWIPDFGGMRVQKNCTGRDIDS
ncbi:hypothetical protein OG989_08525 [Micromonospora sp. NBC_01740]|uniref:hypothetical protein n=1 Tax=Micromonospora sp. NBC_01740 TaxID=2975986 RepID=UPI002E0ED85C|nr:hypothetical protein OG989_08525 [Micromonospora sp. NBC_01740]